MGEQDPLLQSNANIQDEDEEKHSDGPNADVTLNPKALAVSVGLIFGYYFIGVLFTMLSETFVSDTSDGGTSLNFLDSVYFWSITLSTVGYGDYYPVTAGGRIFVIFWILIGLSIVGFALSIVSNYMVEKQKALLERMMAQGGEEEVEEEKKTHYISEAKQKLLYALLALLVLFSIGTLVMCEIEDWPFVEGFYWSVVTATTVGYGDVTPSTNASKAFALVYALLGTVFTALALGTFADTFVEAQREKALKKILHKKLDMGGIIGMDADGDGKVSEQEFLEHMLVKMGKIQESDIIELKTKFRQLDADGSGFLDQDDLEGL
uniref:EF-hand domain-containing protein n=1 Tax=Paramoeba aestuarina TaxID=180227 RepID=A0A7S4KF57_9EUKA|mmetsp:Transcript_17687/g.27707  ORF Transcript_17687/g.27707 Transcript_17687/m.27707 type:complete len:321 (+) Transcript_17687:47-1009(+)|eukprot:CAMPEP_0201507336 /NCGR_PEP_ID=MMETSP0161_2-20130828/1027_1 /ASSEMBLY_ACC=CAM_ASM_000251 /TAXON_ID=180227 /ORGANISM="Neoparamoeba aestuarina, Strain SoJaBio B1-5/56/2" /LENGTH=320 /DNA_ID=CAMNT_0047901673 /DNA_START=43 /DNA_END=1005 /DNA_ORIENTATION=-